jgi:hypothetical protein
LALGLAGIGSPPSLGAQQVAQWTATRAELTAAAERLDALAASSAYSERLRARARTQAAETRARLTRGDFIVGDRIVVVVEGSSPFLDTLTVSATPDVVLGTFGRLELRGVLRSELTERVRTVVGQSVRDANVTVQPLLRVALAGSVMTPGYVLASPETRLDELLTRGGGPAADADLQRMEVVRGDDVILEPAAIVSAIAAGRTIAELGIEQGDMLRLRQRTPPWDRASTLQLVAVVVAPLLTLLVVQ